MGSPLTFRLTAERASRLRHRGLETTVLGNRLDFGILLQRGLKIFSTHQLILNLNIENLDHRTAFCRSVGKLLQIQQMRTTSKILSNVFFLFINADVNKIATASLTLVNKKNVLFNFPSPSLHLTVKILTN